jgi:uncharacterized coiled-coil DUF342 family protein
MFNLTLNESTVDRLVGAVETFSNSFNRMATIMERLTPTEEVLKEEMELRKETAQISKQALPIIQSFISGATDILPIIEDLKPAMVAKAQEAAGAFKEEIESVEVKELNQTVDELRERRDDLGKEVSSLDHEKHKLQMEVIKLKAQIGDLGTEK